MTHPATALASARFGERLDDCIHCGLCLPACPTYEISRTEMEAPRGRIALMAAAAAGRIGLDGAFREHIDLCLGCRACETACPSGVRYGALLEATREALEAHRSRSGFERFARWLGLRQLLPHRRRLRALAGLLRVGQTLGLARLARHLPARLRRVVELLPGLPGGARDDRRAASATGEARGTVALFLGCVQDAFLPGVHAATVRVLERNGWQVRVPAGQTCCGAAALHLGEAELARMLARRNVEAFGAESVDAVVSNAGGCGAMLAEYGELLDGDDRARAFSAAVRDASEMLAAGLQAPPGRVNIRATYADSCHLRHAGGVVDPPRALLRAIPGLEFVELSRPDFCCGSAGVYNLTQPESAAAVLALKLADIEETGASLVVTTNPGCQLQLAAGTARAGSAVEVVHLMELLDRAYATRPAPRPL